MFVPSLCLLNIPYVKMNRFKEVAKLNFVWWFEIHGKISTSKLSLDTNYAAYLVFKLLEEAFGFDSHPAELSLTLGVDKICTKSVFLDPMIERPRGRRLRRWYESGFINHSVMSSLERPKERADGWFESELGEFFNGGDQESELLMIIKTEGKVCLIILGIEIRPKKE